MAMPASGSLSICEVGLGACRSIATAVTSSASGSLSILSVAAGKFAPHWMCEFYGYDPAPPTLAINGCVCWIGTCGAGNGMTGCLRLMCSTTIVCTCTIPAGSPYQQGGFQYTMNPLAGTYCMNFACICVLQASAQVAGDYDWTSDTCACTSDWTNSFSDNETVDVGVYNQ